MTYDDAKRAQDAPFRPIGCGHYGTFKCAACELPKLIPGRRMKFVSRTVGRQYVCRACAEGA
jgi:hypothetical protein